jgi:hypothetical protein
MNDPMVVEFNICAVLEALVLQFDIAHEPYDLLFDGEKRGKFRGSKSFGHPASLWRKCRGAGGRPGLAG